MKATMTMKAVMRFAAFAVFFLAASAPIALAAESSYTGTWDTKTDKGWSYEITFFQKGSQVSGKYVVQNGDKGRINGVVNGDVLQFNWQQDGGYTGTGQFALSPDGNAFQGVYRSDDHPNLKNPSLLQGTWSGTRRPSTDFSGIWDTRTDKGWSYEITFFQKGSRVTGTYIVQNGDKGRIDGVVNGDVLQFNWQQDGGYTGTGQFALSPTGAAFKGVYRADNHANLQDAGLRQGVWSGIRRVR